jgi:hypothetical protein
MKLVCRTGCLPSCCVVMFDRFFAEFDSFSCTVQQIVLPSSPSCLLSAGPILGTAWLYWRGGQGEVHGANRNCIAKSRHRKSQSVAYRYIPAVVR